MPVHRLAEMTWEEVRDLPAEGAAALLPVGALEAHGPHLPLCTDTLISVEVARRAAAGLAGCGSGGDGGTTTTAGDGGATGTPGTEGEIVIGNASSQRY